MFWENPKCQAIYQDTHGKLALQLILDLLQFYKMDYSLSVYQNEANLNINDKLTMQDV